MSETINNCKELNPGIPNNRAACELNKFGAKQELKHLQAQSEINENDPEAGLEKIIQLKIQDNNKNFDLLHTSKNIFSNNPKIEVNKQAYTLKEFINLDLKNKNVSTGWVVIDLDNKLADVEFFVCE